MKNLLLVFNAEGCYIDINLVNGVMNKFYESNFPISEVFFVQDKKITETFNNFENIRQAYDNVFVVKSNCKEFEDGFNKIKNLLYSEDHGKDLFSLFLLDGDIITSVKDNIIPCLEKKYSVKYGKVIFKTYGLTREKILETTREIEKTTGVKFDVYEENLDCSVEIIYDDKSTKMDYDNAQKQFLMAFRDNIYAESNVSLEKILVDLLKLRKCVLSTAESFTGGNISAKITSVSGASQVFYEGIVCYDEHSKNRRLGVKSETLNKYKPVSAQVAGEMAYGLVKDKNANVGIATTGIAGPNSDDSNFPVGLCFIGVACGGEIKVYRYNFDGDRKSVIEKGTKTAMFLAVKAIKNI